MRRVRALSEGDRAAWAAYARHVATLPGRVMPEAPVVAVPEPGPGPGPVVQVAFVAPVRMPRPLAVFLVVGEQPAGVDSATWQKLRLGRLGTSRKLDLHGRTAQRAFQALDGFLRAAHAERLRSVEVITGRGSGEAGGVIRRELPLWLNRPDLRAMVLAAAYPAGNLGSVRLLLRRPRER